MFKYKIEKSVSEIRLKYLKSFLIILFCVFLMVKYKTQKLMSEIRLRYFIQYVFRTYLKNKQKYSKNYSVFILIHFKLLDDKNIIFEIS